MWIPVDIIKTMFGIINHAPISMIIFDQSKFTVGNAKYTLFTY